MTLDELEVIINASDADVAKRKLEGLADAGGKAEGATKRLTTAAAALGGTLAGVGLGAVATNLIHLADAYTRFENSLRVAGATGAALSRVQDQLFVTAQKYGSELGTLGTLYGRLSGAATELGASQADLLRFTDAAAAAIKVQGGDASTASGALMQLSQALGGGTVRAEEFNSILEGARPLAQAAASGMAEYGGSISKLRADVIDGKVSSREFFDAILKGSSALEDQAAKANLTVGASFQVLNNAVSQYVGQADKATGASRAISDAITGVARNLDTIAGAAKVAAQVVGGVMVVSLARVTAGVVQTTIATIAGSAAWRAYALSVAIAGQASAVAAVSSSALAAAMLGLKTAGAGVMAFMGGPLGLAITGAALAVVGLNNALKADEERLKVARDSAIQYSDAIAQADKFLASAAGSSKAFGSANAAAVAGTDALSAATKDLAGYTFSLASARADAARSALIEAQAANDKRIQELRNPGLIGTLGRVVMGPVATRRVSKDNQLADLLEQENAALFAKQIAITFDASSNVPDKVDRIASSIDKAGKAAKDSAEKFAVWNDLTRAMGNAADGVARAMKDVLDAQAARVLNNREAADRISLMEREISLIGAGNKERVTALALQSALQEVARTGGNLNDLATLVKLWNEVDFAATSADLQTKNDNFNASLSYTSDLLGQIDSQARDTASGLASAFGSAGAALGGILTGITGLDARMASIAEHRADLITRAGGDAKRLAQIDILSSRESANARRSAYGDMIASAKGFFEEGSDGYRVLQAAEAGYRAYQLAASIASIAQGAAEAGATVIQKGVEATASGAAGVAKIFSQLGVFAFPVAAAAIAFMASTGARVSGGGGAPTFDLGATQKAQGTGTVLGDSSAKSESLTKALEVAQRGQNKLLEFNNQMVRSLRSIDDKIGLFAAAVSRSIGGGRLFSESGLGLGSTSSRGLGTAGNILTGGLGAAAGGVAGAFAGGALSLAGFAGGGIVGALAGLAPVLGPLGLVLGALVPLLFSGKTTRTLQNSGFSFPDQTVGDISANGFNGSAFQTVIENTTKKFLGITYSNKNKTITQSTGLPDDLSTQLSLIVGSLREGVLSAASVLGLDGAQATIDAFKVSLGEISLKDMTGAEIEAELTAVFGALGDAMAGAVMGGLEKFQQVGEGQFETLVRLARGYQVVDTALASIGRTFGMVGSASIEARQRLVDFAGGIDAFSDQISFFNENFLTEAERMAPIMAAVTVEMARLGLAGIDTVEKFKAAFLSLDLTTAAGAALAASMLNLAPAFKTVEDYELKLAEAQAAAASAAASAASSVRDVADSFGDLTKTLQDFYKSLVMGPLAMLSPEEQYRKTREEFERISGLADKKDQAAQAQLPQAIQAFLEASKGFNASSLGYFKDLEDAKLVLERNGGLPAGFAPTTPGSWLSGGQLQADVSPLREPLASIRTALVAMLGAQMEQVAAVRAEEREEALALLEEMRGLVRVVRANA